jgi:hypothetical protein
MGQGNAGEKAGKAYQNPMLPEVRLQVQRKVEERRFSAAKRFQKNWGFSPCGATQSSQLKPIAKSFASLHTTFSNASVIPMPPLTHSVATPRLVLRFSISCSSVTVMRVPVHPMG